MKKFLKIAFLALTIIGSVGTFSTPVSAHEGHDHGEHPGAQQSEERKEANQERRRGKLDDARKRVCEGRVKSVERIMDKAATQGQKHLEVFNKISVRVQEFYKNKNLQVANYETLLTNIKAKKIDAETAIAVVKGSTTIDCNSHSPVTTADLYSGNIKVMHRALKEYRTAIKDLIVAVKSANSVSEGGE